MRRLVLEWLQERIPAKYWTAFWWFWPLLGILVLPIGILVTFGLGHLGLEGFARLTQLLILASTLHGAVCGLLVLVLVGLAGLPPSRVKLSRILAVVAIVWTPALFGFLAALAQMFAKSR